MSAMRHKNMVAVDLFYWAMMLSACCMGETVADFMSHGPLQLGYAHASIVLVAMVCGSLYAERSARVPNEARYWTTIVIMSTAGTTMADFISRTLDWGYFWGTLFLAVLFAATFLVWHRRAHPKNPLLPDVDLEVHRKSLPQTDARYWTAIMVASTLGTTLGDSLTNGTHLGFGGGSLLRVTVLAIVLFAEHRAKVPNEARYWMALVSASTIGATSGDYLTKEEGLNFGYGWGIGSLVVLFIAITVIGRRRAPSPSAKEAFTFT